MSVAPCAVDEAREAHQKNKSNIHIETSMKEA